MLYGSILLGLAALTPSPGCADDLPALLERSRAAEGTAERAQVLDELARLAVEDEAAAEGATRALAAALEDPVHVVRAHAVELLATAPARGLALDALDAAAREQAASEARLEELVRAGVGEVPHLPGPGRLSRRAAEEAKEEYLEQLRALRERAEETKAQLEANLDLPKVRAALVAALPRFPDERAADALWELSARVPFSDDCHAAVEALLLLGGARALEHVGAVFLRYDEALKERKKLWRELERAKPGKKPSELYADEVWERKELRRIAEARERFQEQAATIDATFERIAERVRADAEARGLPAPPRRIDRGRDWRNWAGKAGKECAPLPGVSAGQRAAPADEGAAAREDAPAGSGAS